MTEKRQESPGASKASTAAAAGGRRERRRAQAAASSPLVPAAEPTRPSFWLIAGLCLALVWAVAAIYAQTYHHAFIAYDDYDYIYANPIVKEGLTAHGFAWAFTSFHGSNWLPVTWLTHMLDCQLFDQKAGCHHLVNAGLHAANTLLLFMAFVMMTGRPWQSAIVAAIFAVHPMHVESVAWAAERKDVLSTFFGLVALLFYIRYVRRRTVARYLPVAAVFALALMSKPMLVTFPFVLLLLDIWPLGRLRRPFRWARFGPVLLEKTPLLALSLAESIVTYKAQQVTGAMKVGASLYERFANSVVGYVTYIGDAFCPRKMAVLYPLQPVAPGSVVAAAILLAVITIVVLVFVGKRPYLFVGWFWFLGTLVPVSGIVQVGSQSTADRYTYLPFVGLSIMVVWLAADLVEGRKAARMVAAAVASAALIALGTIAEMQTAHWKSSETLFEHTLAVTRNNSIIYNNYGVALVQDKRFDEALAAYKKAIEINPNYADAEASIGHELLSLGKGQEAYEHLMKAIHINPNESLALADVAVMSAASNRLAEAEELFKRSIAASPEHSEVHSNYAYVLVRLGRYDEAIAQCKESLRIDPEFADAHYNFGNALAGKGKKSEAIAQYRIVLKLKPAYTDAKAALERLLAEK